MSLRRMGQPNIILLSAARPVTKFIYTVAVFYILLTVNLCIILQIKPNWCRIFLSMFISFFHIFWATMCPSSGKITVSMRHLLFVTLVCLPDSHPHRVTNTKCRIDSYFSWWLAHSSPKHVENRNKHTKKKFAPSWLYLQDYTVAIFG
jgi:hypothetical protein